MLFAKIITKCNVHTLGYYRTIINQSRVHHSVRTTCSHSCDRITLKINLHIPDPATQSQLSSCQVLFLNRRCTSSRANTIADEHQPSCCVALRCVAQQELAQRKAAQLFHSRKPNTRLISPSHHFEAAILLQCLGEGWWRNKPHKNRTKFKVYTTTTRFIDIR